jgi:hypothetical protein
MNFKKLFLFCIPFLFISCLSTSSEPDGSSIRNIIDWAELEDDIFSWSGQSKSALVRAWGLPDYSMDIGNGEEQYEYYSSSSYQTTTGNESTVSKYNEITEKTYSTTTKTETTTTNTRSGTVRFTIVNNTIDYISYEGNYYELKKICKSRGDNSSYAEPLVYNQVWLRVRHDPSFEDFTTEELFELLVPLSDYYNNIEFSKNLFIDKVESYRKSHKSLSKTKAHDYLVFSSRSLSSSNIEFFLAELFVYNELFENEQFDWEPYFISAEEKKALEEQKIKEQTEALKQKALDDLEKEVAERAQQADKICKYTMDDFNSGRVKWQNVPLKDIQALKAYSTPMLIDYLDNQYDYRKDILGFVDGKGEEDVIYVINDFLSYKLNYANVYSWIKWIEYYYEVYPQRLPK